MATRDEILARFDETAAYWDCDEDAERLTADDPVTALEEHLSGWGPDEIHDSAPITVYPWTRKVITPETVKYYTEQLMDHLQETLDEDEELSDPDGEQELLPRKLQEEFLPELQALVGRILARVTPWQCEQGKGVELTAEEVFTLCPDLLPEEKTIR